MAAMLVHELALHVATDQRLEFLLSVNVDQAVAQIAHRLCRQGLTVDILPRTPVQADHPAQNDFVAVIGQRLFVEPAPHALVSLHVECGGDLGAFSTVAQ
jgi:hypothetical protein